MSDTLLPPATGNDPVAMLEDEIARLKAKLRAGNKPHVEQLELDNMRLQGMLQAYQHRGVRMVELHDEAEKVLAGFETVEVVPKGAYRAMEQAMEECVTFVRNWETQGIATGGLPVWMRSWIGNVCDLVWKTKESGELSDGE